MAGVAHGDVDPRHQAERGRPYADQRAVRAPRRVARPPPHLAPAQQAAPAARGRAAGAGQERGVPPLPDPPRRLAGRAGLARRRRGVHGADPAVHVQGDARGEGPRELDQSESGLRRGSAAVRFGDPRPLAQEPLPRGLPPLPAPRRDLGHVQLPLPDPPEACRPRGARRLPGDGAVGLEPGRPGQPAAGRLRAAPARARGPRTRDGGGGRRPGGAGPRAHA